MMDIRSEDWMWDLIRDESLRPRKLGGQNPDHPRDATRTVYYTLWCASRSTREMCRRCTWIAIIPGRPSYGDADVARFSRLAEALKGLPGLLQLDLTWNKIGPEGAGILVEALQGTPRLEYLSLRGSHIGAAKLVEALKVLPCLQHLNLADNEIGDEGAASVAQALKALPCLQHLDLGCERWW
eukprot:TRINITY_DN1439_c0_g1_i9.p1 TRINITY_DN1439_c0_g1~~TRINITY_DN1439_c0_g1_i9.p1  ORF type:complete len:183 (+),score=23.30 TRINITY_DN1439_c0_g1_i9:273-821(+)